MMVCQVLSDGGHNEPWAMRCTDTPEPLCGRQLAIGVLDRPGAACVIPRGAGVNIVDLEHRLPDQVDVLVGGACALGLGHLEGQPMAKVVA
jgi:hypothetical protein